MRLLVLGKTGQVATSLKKLCAAGTVEATIAGRNTCDITDYRAVVDLLQQSRPNAVINAAAYTAVDDAEADKETALNVNANGAGHVAKAAAQTGIPVLHISTDYVFSGDKQKPYREEDETGPQSVYGASKLAGEIQVADANPKHLILRTAWVYSSTGKNFVRTMLRLAGERDQVNVVADQVGNPTSADEIAVALIGAAQKMVSHPQDDHFGVFHFCGTEKMSWAGFAREIFELSKVYGGPHALVNEISTDEYPTPAKRPSNSSLDCSKFGAAFGLEQLSFKKALDQTVSQLLR